jgi:hypothetical protein
MSYRSHLPGPPGTRAGFWPCADEAAPQPGSTCDRMGFRHAPGSDPRPDCRGSRLGLLMAHASGGARPGVLGCAGRGSASHRVAPGNGGTGLARRRLVVALAVPAAVALPGRHDPQRPGMTVAFVSGETL